MLYIYDILLNFSKNRLYEFYEWDSKDKIDHVKKIKVVKVESSVLDDFFNYQIKLLDDLCNEIDKGMELFQNKQNKKAMLFTDGYRVLAILFNDEYKSISKSKLLLEEELDVLDISEKLNVIPINYRKKNKEEEITLTRREYKIREFLQKEIKRAYKSNDINKLKYIYIEYFNKEEKDKLKMYQELLNDMNVINEKHIMLYDMLNPHLNRQTN